VIHHPGCPITVYEVASVFTMAYVKGATVGNAMRGFQLAGVCPSTRVFFSEFDFITITITELPSLRNCFLTETN
jgi:hypothetical protein